MDAVILAGGQGTRMGPLTDHVPKPLLYLPGGTLLEHQLQLLQPVPLNEIFVVVRYQGEKIREAIHDFPNVTAIEQDPPFTLLGALATAVRRASGPLLVLHGDNYFSRPIEYLPLDRPPPPLTFVYDPAWPPADDRAAQLANTGTYLLSRDILPNLERLVGENYLIELVRALLRTEQGILGVKLRGWRQNVNTPSDLLNLNRRLLNEWVWSFHPDDSDAGYEQLETDFTAPLWISPTARVESTQIGRYTTVGDNARVIDSVISEALIFPDARIVGETARRAIVIDETIHTL